MSSIVRCIGEKKTEKWNVSTKIWAKCEHKQRHTPGVTVNSNYYYKLKRIRPFETIATQYLINSIIGPALLMITIFSARSEIQTRIPIDGKITFNIFISEINHLFARRYIRNSGNIIGRCQTIDTAPSIFRK